MEFLRSSADYKQARIELLFTRYPKRQFILVGDSGENDPAVYAEAARRHPEQVQRIYIREVHAAENVPNYRQLFSHLKPDQWTVFGHPRELKVKSVKALTSGIN